MSTDRPPRRTFKQGAKTRSPIQTKTSEVTQRLQERIQEIFSGPLYEITRELMDLDSPNSATKEQFRQFCNCHRLRLSNDQVEKENVFTPAYIPVKYNSENSKRRHSRK